MRYQSRGATDRRWQRSKRLLREALVKLIHEKPYDAIVVKEILDRAAVARSTFYAHFRNKDDLLLHGIHEILRSGPAVPLPASRSQRLAWFSRPLLEYVDGHRRDRNGRSVAAGRATIHAHLQRVIEEVVNDALNAGVQKQLNAELSMPPELISRHVAATFVLVLDWWVESQSELSARDTDRLFHALIAPTLDGLRS
jgi:AcrR family transcriptional regulator